MDLKERMKKSIENFIRFGGNTKTVELDQESMATIDDIKDDGITDFKIDNIPLTREVAMKITALNEGINQIADSISALPVYSYKREDDGSRQSLTAMLKRFFSGGKNAGKILILDDGMKFKGLSLSPAEMNLLQQKSFTVEDIARLLKMPSYMLGASGSSMVYSNVEQTQLMFLQMTIDPILRLIEDTFNKYLLTEDEKESGFFFEFNTQNMLRTTPEKEILMYANAVKGSLITVNEARRKMNWNHLKGMDRPIVMSGTCTINENGEVIGVNSEPAKGGEGDRVQFREKINEGVFERAINRALENGDIFFLYQHDNRALPLASVKSNTLELIEDKENNQLKMRAVLPNTSFSRDVYELVKSGVLREFSFGFNKPKSKWNVGKDGIKERSLIDFDIHEISIVRVGAYNETVAYARAFEELQKDLNENNNKYRCNKNKMKVLKLYEYGKI